MCHRRRTSCQYLNFEARFLFILMKKMRHKSQQNIFYVWQILSEEHDVANTITFLSKSSGEGV
ncbi:hypothetical protein BvCmsKKNP001_01392 [Escherichia coli]|nr:hypothetical protein BvCmsKKNP001_01392 [Escherichia coli]